MKTSTIIVKLTVLIIFALAGIGGVKASSTGERVSESSALAPVEGSIVHTPWSAPPSGTLLVKSGQRKTISPGSVRYFKSIMVESGGILDISRGRARFTSIKSAGDCNIHGLVVSQNFKSPAGSFSQTAPDGQQLLAELDESNIGGDGGRGSDTSQYHGKCVANGGMGAPGTTKYGGGGGSDSWVSVVGGHCTRYYHGVDAKDWRGARQRKVGSGGNGGKRGRNGGYLYLNCVGTLNVEGGKFIMSGESGQGGGGGITRSRYQRNKSSGSGGGGPGGHGGFLYLKYGKLKGELNVDVSGGQGGAAGYNAEYNGTKGEDGYPGEVIEIY